MVLPTVKFLNSYLLGSGVYLAEDCATSFSYIRYQQSWDKSMFGNSNLGIMAMCEIIKHPDYNNMPNPYYVIKDDEHLSTRYFFIWENSGSATVYGKQVKVPDIDWS
jgi:hypothetical protein